MAVTAYLPDDLDSGDRAAEAYSELRELIVRGRLAPGTRIIERDVAARLGISRTPIRSALQRLQQEGYVTASGNGKQTRLSVAPLTVDDARELFSIVGNIEGLAARRAAELESPARLRLARVLRRFNGNLLSAAQATPPNTNLLFELDRDFHRTYVEAAAGPRLLVLHDAIKPQVERYNRLYATALAGEIHKSVDEHDSIIRGIAAGEPEGAERAACTNFGNAAERLSEVIATFGERGSWLQGSPAASEVAAGSR